MNGASTVIDLDGLLQPVSAERPAGEDMSFSPILDEIEEARKADDPSLARGVWQAELKEADWPRVVELAGKALGDQSKDLQLAAWLTEALAHLHGFRGLADGLTLIEGLLSRFWDDLYPEAADGDQTARANRLARLSQILAHGLTGLPLTADGYGFRAWQESRAVENLGLRDAKAKQAALAEGKLDAERWDKAVAATPAEQIARLHADLSAARAAFGALTRTVDERFGSDAPSLRDLGRTIDDVLELVTDVARGRGVQVAPPADGDGRATGLGAGGAAQPPGQEQAVAGDGAAGGGPVAVADAGGRVPVSAAGGNPAAGPPRTRQEALRRLEEVAAYFRANEPHSPVAYLLDRAVKWGNMPLDRWLQEVVKDKNVLGELNETLGLGTEG